MLYTYYSGSADIIGNNIGDTTTTESIVINTLSSSTTNAIAIRTIEASNIQNNIIGSIKLVGDVAIANNFNGIYISPNTSSTLLINGNYIGSYSTADNIICSASATSSPTGQTMRGIYSQSQGSTTISNNTIAGITNNYSGTYNTNTLAGIYVDRGTNTIQNNVVKKLKTASGNTGNFGLASIYGIGISNTNNGVTQLVSGNEVSHIYNTNNNQSVVLSGLFFEGADDVFHQISGNYIHTLELSTSNISSKTMGVCLYRGKANFYNNIIHLGKDYTNMHYMYGMWDNAYSLASLNMYFNTLFIDGTSAEGSINSTYALWNQTNSGTARNLKNNIITNLRSGGTDGSHYSIRIANTTDMTIDYNNYYVSDGMLAAFGNTNITTIEDWKVVTAQDVNSYNGNPDFMNTGSGYEKLYPTFPCNGLAGLGIENDYTGQTRSSTLPKLGALEINESVWTGTIDTDFATAGNWEDGFVPTPGTNLRFTATPSNHCVLDANRTVGNIVNPSNKDLVLNAHKLTIVGNTFFSSTGLIDGLVANSSIEFAGDDAQTFEANIIKDSIIDYLIINNSNNVTLDGNITINEELNLSIGDFSIGDNILELNGLISTTSGSMTGGILSTIIFGGAGATTSLPAISLSTLEVNRASGISFSGNVVLADTLKLTNGTLDIAGYNFDLGIDTIMITTGNIDASTINTTLQFTNTDTLYLPNSVFAGGGNVVYNLMIDDYGLYSETDISITNQLYLNSNNPTATRGLLDMRTTKVLTMQASATTVGQGDVTGRILRNSISANTVYTFGSEYNKLIFTDGTGAELPSEILFITVIGESHPIKTNSINRYHQIIRTGGTAPTRFGLTLRYLDSELNNNDENNLVYWDHHVPYAGTSPHEHGKSSQDFVNKTLTLSSHGIGYLAPEEYAGEVVYVDDITTPPNKSKIWLISNKESVADYEWIGAESSDWTNVANWSGGAVPDATSEVYIPGNTPNDPTLPDGATEIERIEIAIDGVLNAGTGSELTINGNLDDNNGNVSFNNKGTFNQGNSTIIFSGTNAVISGIVDFYNITISVGAALSMIEGTKMRIENTFTNDGTFYSNMLGASTVEYFGDAQDIILPESNTYSSLILSGSGNKTLPASALSIAEDLQISGTANVIAQEEITIDNNFLIATNSTFNTGAFNHSIGGNMEVSGTLAANAANTIEFNGTQQQLIFGSGNPQFGILQINNLNGVLMGLDVETETELKLTNGDLFVGNNTLGINGTISGTTNIVVDNSSSISFGGTDAIVIPDNIFNTNPSINNLTIDRTGGVTLGNQTFTINGVLSLTSGSLVADGKTLSIAGAISSTTGTLSTNNSTSLNFAENENMLTIPNDIFTTQNLGTVYINRTGGITLGNQEINIDTKLILENGILYSNGNTINFTANAEVGTSLVNTTPGSDLSYIEGCVAKLGNTAFTFPIGDSGLHAPIGISAADGGGSVAGEFTACYYNEAYTNIEDLELGIDHVSSAEHWILNRSAELNNVAITLYWNQTRSGGIDNLEDLAVVRWSGTEWENHGNTATSEVGDWGTITSEIITRFSPITLASTSESNPLPIELEYIKSECLDYESNASVEWKTLSEKNNEKFILELSYNSKIWKEIGSVIGNGNSTISHTYTFSHNHSNIVEPELYYRLKQIDYDGKYSYSYIISQSNCNNTNGVKVFPNPFGNQISINMEILNSEFISISLTDVYGIEHIHYNEKIENGKYLKTFDTSFLTRGIYFIEVGLNHKTLTKKIIKY